MLLVDQVDVLRRNLPEIKEMRCALPLCGGYKNTKAAYHFAYLLLPARDIITTIKAVEPRENTLPDRIRGWKITVTDEYRIEELAHLKDILGKIIHMHYLRFDEELDVSNDLDERIIVPRDVFLQQIGRLVLEYKDICLVVCALAEKSYHGEKTVRNRKTNSQNTEGPGFRDLQKILRDIRLWPELENIIWDEYFKDQSKNIEPDSDTINGIPFVNKTYSSASETSWRIGWRRGAIYSKAWIDVLQIITTIRDYFLRV